MAIGQRREISDGTLSIRVDEEGPSCVIALRGELDLANAGILEAELETAMATEAEVVIDMRELEFIDSSGIALLIGAMGQDGGSPRLSFVPSEFAAVTRVLELTGVTERMPIAEGSFSDASSTDGLQTA
jgi:anti-anti-sigma factor